MLHVSARWVSQNLSAHDRHWRVASPQAVTEPLTVRLWKQFFWDTDGLLMTDYLHPGITTTGQY